LKLTQIPLPELNRKAFAILSRELGVPDTLRFFGQLGLDRGNYTEERRTLFANQNPSLKRERRKHSPSLTLQARTVIRHIVCLTSFTPRFRFPV
jgi:hypothetical protein